MRLVWGLLAALVVLLAGFWPSFFSNPGQLDALHILHGIFATGWMLILILQAWLMASGKLTLHHWIGRLSPIWVAGLLFTAVRIMMYSLGSTARHALPMPVRPILIFFDIPSLITFAGFYAAAIYFAFKRVIDLHYRLLVSTVIIVMLPAVFRALQYLPIFDSLGAIIAPSFWIMEATCIGLIVYDYVVHKKTFAPYWLTLALFVVLQVSYPYVTGFAPYMALIRVMGYPG